MSEKDELEFDALMQQAGVVKLGDKRDMRERKQAARSVEAARAATEEEEFEVAMASLDAAPDKDVWQRPAADVPERVQRLHLPRRATLHLDAQLDLHGLNQEEAVNRLELFVGNAAVTGMRRVLVVTGKGRHSDGGVSVLRPVVEAWIGTDGARLVAAWGEAPRQYGGSGALVLDIRVSSRPDSDG